MTLVTLQIAIEALQVQIENLRIVKNEAEVSEHMVDYLTTRINDMEIAQNELAIETLSIELQKK
tara:strand:- start:1466 stop:1657 length:192 start_codon:yes stop_codon:yes gene_type:complete